MSITTAELELNESLLDDNLIEVYQTDSIGFRREKKTLLSVMKTYFQGLLPGRITQNESDISDDVTDLVNLKDGTDPFEALSLSSGRTAFQELTSGTLSTSGWYTIAEFASTGFDAAASMFRVFLENNRTMLVNAEFSNADVPRDGTNTTIEILGQSKFTKATSVNLTGARIAKSDSVRAGAKLQISFSGNPNNEMRVLKLGNIAKESDLGWELVTPYLDNTPTLPDGVTPATFLEAGAELSLDTNATYLFPNIVSYKASDDQMRCVAVWPEEPKQGTSLEITLPSATLRFNGGGVSLTLDGTETISDFAINGRYVSFRSNKVGGYSTLSYNENYFFWVAGTGCKLTIED